MIVEFIGSTGAGKTTLIREVHRRLAKTASVTTSVDLAAGLLGLRSVTHPTLQNLIQEMVGFPFFVGTLHHYRRFLNHTIRLFLRNSSFSIRTINNLRSLERKIGMYEVMRRTRKDHIVLVDEGPILAAHMFAFTGNTYTLDEITQFTDLLPLPDLVVYVRASVDTILERTLQRADPPREIDVKNRAQTEAYAKSAVALFNQLIQAENIHCRLLVVESPNMAEPGYEEVINSISQSILDRRVERNPMNPNRQIIETKTLTKIQELIERLRSYGIPYCHWKSNLSLPETLTGQTDVDLLVQRKFADAFRLILSQLQFRPAGIQGDPPFPAVEHYFAFDQETGILVHVHAYYRVITGESLSKNLHLPLEEMLIKNVREEYSVPVPVKSAELVIFTIRMMLKHTSIVEILLLARDWKGMKREVEWLLDAKSTNDTLKLVEDWLPSVDTGLFSECISALQQPASLFRRILLGRKLRSQLRLYARHSRIQAWLSGIKKFILMAYGRLTHAKRGMILQSGGIVIAFVGPEATGKSTLLDETKRWLGEHFVINQIHAGKPKSTPLTMLPNVGIPILRSVLPSYRPSRIGTRMASKEQAQKSPEVYPLISAIRSVFLAYDRRALLTRAFARAANGSILLCDRYPSMSKNAPDGPQLQQFEIDRKRHPLRHWLARTEKRLYQEIPSPDLVISLQVPIAVALLRNKTRGKEEPEDYVRFRHAQASNLQYGNAPIIEINTDQPLDKTVLEVKKAIWDAL